MNKILCRYFQQKSYEFFEICINYDLHNPHTVFYLNAIICIELLLKNLIIYNKYITTAASGSDEQLYQKFRVSLMEELKNYNHCLVRLFEFDVQLSAVLGLKSITHEYNEFENVYILTFNDSKRIFLPTLEAVRYNVLATQQNVLDVNSPSNVNYIKELISDLKDYIVARVKY